MNIGSIRKLVIGGVALHSLVLGAALTVSPIRILDLCGWPHGNLAFFPRQSGVFLLLMGMVYAVGVWKRPFGWLLVLSKVAAVILLIGGYLAGEAPRLALLMALADGLMGATVAAILTCEALAQRRHGSASGLRPHCRSSPNR